MIVDFTKHQWVHQGNINKVKKLIMDVKEYQQIRIYALRKKVKELEIELKLEHENKLRIVTELELALEHEKDKDNTEGDMGCDTPKCVCK